MNGVIKKIYKRGIKWFFWRIQKEIRSPSNPYIKKTMDGYLKIKMKHFLNKSNNQEDKLLYVIYDLEIAPITFNVTEFLLDSEYEANRLGKEGFVVVFVPRKGDSLYGWKEYDNIFDSDSKFWRFHNIVLPITLLAIKCKGIYILPDRSSVFEIIKDHQVYPNSYDGINLRYIDIVEFYKKLDKPYLVKGLRASKEGLRYIEDWLKENEIDSQVVTITLRQSDFDPARNNRIDDWNRFSGNLKKKGYFPVIIPDTDNSFKTEDHFPDVFIFNECSWNMGLRMALYEKSFVNFFVASGPLMLASGNERVRYIAMNMLPKDSLVTTEEAYRKVKHNIGDNYKWAWPKQHLVYKPDTYKNILSEFKDFTNEEKNQ